jgi:hypothetical protein
LGVLPETLKDAHKILANTHWEEYERYYNVTLAPGESYNKDEHLFKTSNAGKWIVTCAWGDWHERVPEGMVGCYAIRNEDVTNPRYYLVPKNEYDTRGPFGFVINGHTPWTGPN